MTLGNRIRIARERLGAKYTQKWLGDQLGTTPQAISEWERGGNPEVDKVAPLRKHLRVTLAWLLIGVGDPPHPGDPAVQFEDQLQAQADSAVLRRPAATPKRRRPD